MSTLINTIRGLRPCDPGADAVGMPETTKEVRAYPRPSHPRMVLWELPVCGVPRFPRETYTDKVQLSRYDVCLIVTSSRMSENHLWLAQEAIKRGKAVFIVRTKIDMGLFSEREDFPETFNEETCLERKRNDIKQSIGTRLDAPTIFLISGKLRQINRWDFPDLMRRLCEVNAARWM